MALIAAHLNAGVILVVTAGVALGTVSLFPCLWDLGHRQYGLFRDNSAWNKFNQPAPPPPPPNCTWFLILWDQPAPPPPAILHQQSVPVKPDRMKQKGLETNESEKARSRRQGRNINLEDVIKMLRTQASDRRNYYFYGAPSRHLSVTECIVYCKCTVSS